MTNLDKTMEQNEDEVITHENDTETTDNQDQDLDTNLEEAEEVDVEAILKENATLKAQKNHWKDKATKTREVKTETQSSNLNSKDLFALMKANVSEEDIDDVVEYATFKKIPVSEALKTSAVKAILADKSEFRKTAEVTNTGNSRRNVSKVSDEILLSNMKKGIIPEKGSDEAERVFWAKRGGKRQ